MHTFLNISCKDSTLIYLDIYYGSLEILVLNLSQKLLLTKLINSQNAAHTSYQSTLVFVKCKRDILAWR